MSKPDRGMPDWLLERVLLDEVPKSRRGAVDDRSPETRARLAALEQSNAETLATLPPASVAAEVQARSRRARKSAPRRRAAWMTVMAATAAVALVWIARDQTVASSPAHENAPRAEVTRAKGVPHLLIHRQRHHRIEQLDPATARARAGDRLQVSYLAAGQDHGIVLSIDGAGVVTLHFPERAGDSTRIRQGGAVALGHSYELDDAPGYERFVFVTSAEPIDVAAVLASAKKLARDRQRARHAPLALAPGLQQWSVTLDKEDSP